VDDDPIILKFVSANLNARGFKVLTAGDGESGLKVLEQTLPDLIILDLLMPGIDGYEVCRRIREWSNVPIIVLTAIGESNAKLKLLELGANDYITKPFDIGDLMEHVREILQLEPGENASPSPKIKGIGSKVK